MSGSVRDSGDRSDGEHNDAVLGDLPGLGAAEIAALRDSGVIGDRPAARG